LKADLHIHTKYSRDCANKLEKIVSRCLETGINCIAVADHGTIEGALKLRDIAPFQVIIAEEVDTPFGEIMGLFLSKPIPDKTSIQNAIKQIKEQNGWFAFHILAMKCAYQR